MRYDLRIYALFPKIDHYVNHCAVCRFGPIGSDFQGDSGGAAGILDVAMTGDQSALHLVFSGDPALFAIVQLSLIVSLSAVLFAGLIGVPVGAFLALTRFPGREVTIVVLNAMMGLPPVVVGLAIYLLLSRSGPLGALGLLFTPQAMMIAQTVLVAPIIAALTRQTVEDLWVEYREELAAMNVGPLRPRSDADLGRALFAW